MFENYDATTPRKENRIYLLIESQRYNDVHGAALRIFVNYYVLSLDNLKLKNTS